MQNEKDELIIKEFDTTRAKMYKRITDDVFFGDVYEDAYKCVREIKERSVKFENMDHKEKWRELKGYPSNAIVFDGKIGQGKTSVMQTFSHFLERLENNKDHDEKELEKVGCEAGFDEKYAVLDSIDASLMTRYQSIVRIVLSKIFYEVQQIMEINTDICEMLDSCGHIRKDCDFKKMDMNMRQNLAAVLYQQFDKCYRHIRFINNDKKDEDYSMLEDLAMLSNSGFLKKDLYCLIKLFLKLKFGECGDNAYLVIQIDDLDCADDHIQEICEELHHYLRLPNVIVLIGADMERLKDVMTWKFLSRVKDMKDFVKDRYELLRKSTIEATEYVRKVFPFKNRLSLVITYHEYRNDNKESSLLDSMLKVLCNKKDKEEKTLKEGESSIEKEEESNKVSENEEEKTSNEGESSIEKEEESNKVSENEEEKTLKEGESSIEKKEESNKAGKSDDVDEGRPCKDTLIKFIRTLNVREVKELCEIFASDEEEKYEEMKERFKRFFEKEWCLSHLGMDCSGLTHASTIENNDEKTVDKHEYDAIVKELGEIQ